MASLHWRIRRTNDLLPDAPANGWWNMEFREVCRDGIS